MLLINNRRYIGNKKLLMENIFDVVESNIEKKDYIFADLFAGTGVVSDFFLKKGKNVIVNDTLYSNYVAYQTWLGDGAVNWRKLEKIIETFNNIDALKVNDNYFSKIYGNKYFSIEDSRKIGYIRDQIEKMRLTKREECILVTSLIYAIDKIANTVGHFEHFLAKRPIFKNFKLELPFVSSRNAHAEIYMTDANKLAKKIECDVAYIDPPYNARQYINFYHVLENLARWEKPKEFEGVSMKFKRNNLKSDYSKSKAPKVFRDLIENIKAKLIIVSYNNTYSAKSSASNNKISEKEIEQILKNKGEIIGIKSFDHKFFNSGKTNFKEHKEKLYICKVN